MDILLWLAVIAGLVWFWADSARAREQMLKRLRRLCQEMNVQLLDETASLARLTLGRGVEGHVQLRRRYTFEYSISGVDRWRGTAELRGRYIECIHMEHPNGPVIVAGAGRVETPWR